MSSCVDKMSYSQTLSPAAVAAGDVRSISPTRRPSPCRTSSGVSIFPVELPAPLPSRAGSINNKLITTTSSSGHKRTKSAGNYCCGRGGGGADVYMRTGLYAHRPAAAFDRRALNHADLLMTTTTTSTSVGGSSLYHRGQRFAASEVNVSRLLDDHCTACSVKQPSVALLAGNMELVKTRLPDDGDHDRCVVDSDDELDDAECGILSFRPTRLQRFATIQVFVFFSCLLVTLNQALSSGYFNRYVSVYCPKVSDNVLNDLLRNVQAKAE